MLNYYYYTNSKYTKKLSREIGIVYELYLSRNKVREKDKDSLRYTIGNLLFNCVRCTQTNTDKLVYMRDKKFYTDGIIVNGAITKIKVSSTFLFKLIDILECEDYLSSYVGGEFIYRDHIDSHGEIKKLAEGRTSSVLTLLPKMFSLLKEKEVDTNLSDVLVLRDKEKKSMVFDRTTITDSMVDFIVNYNIFLREHKFTYADGKEIAEPFLNRIFNTSFKLGGRFYTQNGVIQTMPQHKRKTILIDNECCVELDASALHPSILATKAGIKVDYDPYSFEVPANIDYNAITEYKVKYNKPDYDPIRAICKICLLLAFNTKSRGETLSSLSRKFKEDSKLPIEDQNYYGVSCVNLSELYINMENRNVAICEYFGSGAGSYLQFLDSGWMESVLCYCIQADIPAIPIHDSLVCPKSKASEVERFMRLAFKQSFGDDHNLKIKEK